jgi:lipopolysaccharide export system protein LptA
MAPRTSAGGVLAVSAAILLAGCGSSASKASSAASTAASSAASPTAPSSASAATITTVSGNFDSCSVVTQAEAATAIGQAVTPGVLGNATVEGGRACVFYGPSAPSARNPNVAQPDSVRVVVVKGPHAVASYTDYKSKVNAQPISGYGDQAYYDGYASLSVLKGDSYLRIAVAPAGAPPSLAAEKMLAAAVLPKL